MIILFIMCIGFGLYFGCILTGQPYLIQDTILQFIGKKINIPVIKGIGYGVYGLALVAGVLLMLIGI